MVAVRGLLPGSGHRDPIAGYLFGPRVGAWTYNIVHSYATPATVGLVCWWLQWPVGSLLIWTAHIGFDRLLGYGLKYPTAFRDTHLRMAGPATLRWPVRRIVT